MAEERWIPVTERLPKPNEYENGVRKHYLIQNEYGDMMVCSWDGCFWTQMYRITHVADKVVAWMPLPTPYREIEIFQYCSTDSETVDAVLVRHGQWIHHDSNDNHVPPYDECSQCGWKVRIGLNFCPHCGTKNRKDGDNHED